MRYIKGDLFARTSDVAVVLAHACNPHGSWGGGIAAVFRQKYPSANKLYVDHCRKNKNLLGTSAVFPTLESDPGYTGPAYIACLFTSNFDNTPEEIVQHTRTSTQHLEKQLQSLETETENGRKVVNMPKINSGIFAVPWELTAAALDDSRLQINVYTL